MALQKLTKTGMSQALLIKAFNEVIAWTTETDSDLDKLNDYMHYDNQRDGVVGGDHAMVTGSDDSTMVRLSGVVRYRISGVEYVQTTVEGAFSDTGVVTATKYGAWRILIGKTGALTTQSSTAAGTGTQAHESAEQAFASLAQLAITANTVEVGYLTMQGGGTNFVPNTDDPDSGHANVTSNTYYNCRAPRLDNGLTAAPSVGLSEGTNTDEYAWGTINARTNGVNVAEIAADTSQAFTQADTITGDTQYGGHLICTDTAGTAIITIPATGIMGNATAAMAYTTSALCNTALDNAQAALPNVFTVIGRIVVLAAKASFTYNTDAIDGTALKGTGTFTDSVTTDFDRTVTSGATVGIDPPTIPATVTAPIPSLVDL